MSRFLDVLRGRTPDTTPVWVMRQAGRYLPEYRAVREKHPFLEMCKTPELAAEVTLQPLRRFPLDAAILFSDILIPLEGMGQALSFHEGEGPKLAPVRDEAAVAGLEPDRLPEATAFVPGAIRVIRKELAGRTPLIGFTGAPFTLACYAVEGGGSHNFRWVRELMYGRPDLFHRLLETITEGNARYLRSQVEAGVDAVQLFDTWGGILAPAEFAAFALPYVKRLLAMVEGLGVPTVYFVLDGWHLVDLAAGAGSTVLGVDWRVPLVTVREKVGPTRVLQGNLDPGALYGSEDNLRRQVAQVLRGGGAGHVFNLGHGIWPDADPARVGLLVDVVHELGRFPRA
jgi:uroporphyrinogen decarboxylase